MSEVSRARRKRVGLAGLIAGLTMALTAPQVLAAGGIGGSGPSGGGSGGGSGSSNSINCVNGQGWLQGPGVNKQWFVGGPEGADNFVRCGVPASSWKTTDQHAFCNTGFLVYRFYSRGQDQPNSTYAWTRSRANVPADCSGKEVTFFAPHPSDAPTQPVGNGYDLGGIGGTIWAGGTQQRNQLGRPVTYTRDGKLSTSGVEARIGDCRDMQAGFNGRPEDPIHKYFAKDATGKYDPLYAPARESLFNAFRDWQKVLGTHGALTVINAADSPDRLPNNPDEIQYGDRYDCGSDFDFATVEGAEEPVYYGTCWVPLNWRARKFTSAANSAQSSWQYFAAGASGGERVDSSEGDVPAMAGQGKFWPWRDVIRNDVNGNNTIGVPYQGASGNNNGSPWKTAGNGDAAYRAARCVGATATTTGSKQEQTSVPKADGIELNVTMDANFQSGGALRPGSLSVSRGTLYCAGGVPCSQVEGSSQPSLNKLYFGVELEGLGGYSSCASPNSEVCDFFAPKGAYVSHNRPQSSRAVDKDISLDKQLRFFSATKPTEDLRVRITGGADSSAKPYAQVKIRQFVTEYITFRPPSSTSSDGTPATGVSVQIQPITREVSPIYQDIPVRIVTKGNTPKPNEGEYAWKLKVLGATDKPMFPSAAPRS